MEIKNFVFWSGMLFIFGLGIYLVFWINSESFQCLSNPYIYSINLLEKGNDATVTALITTSKGDKQGVQVLLDNQGFHPYIFGREEGSGGSPNNNLSNFNFSNLETIK